MELSDWAKKEIALIKCKEDDEYTNGILNSAVKAFLSLCEDGHSGMSIGFTKNILDRLIRCKPLTVLTGDDSEWEVISIEKDNYIQYQNKRCSSVFKKVYANGDIEYSDIDRVVCENLANGITYYSGSIIKVVDRFLPVITMPYYPPVDPIRVFVEDFLVDPANGDFDTRGIFYAITPSGERIEINVYQAEIDGEFKEISREEYIQRRSIRVDGQLEHSDLTDIQNKIFELENKNDTGKISDGYHTFDELYYHRMMLFSIICNTYKDSAWKSWKHHEGDKEMYDDMFIVGVTTPAGDYSYHYNSKFWDKFDVKELERAPKYDGHKPEDITRLETLL